MRVCCCCERREHCIRTLAALVGGMQIILSSQSRMQACRVRTSSIMRDPRPPRIITKHFRKPKNTSPSAKRRHPAPEPDAALYHRLRNARPFDQGHLVNLCSRGRRTDENILDERPFVAVSNQSPKLCPQFVNVRRRHGPYSSAPNQSGIRLTPPPAATLPARAAVAAGSGPCSPSCASRGPNSRDTHRRGPGGVPARYGRGS
jgi:hypothetical protein